MARKAKAQQAAPNSTVSASADSGGEQAISASIVVEWSLAELPSAQHRAGLAGLVMLVDYTKRHPLRDGAQLEVVALDELSYSLRLNVAGLTALFDRVYAAAKGEVDRPKPWTRKLADGTKEEVPPKRREIRTVTGKKGELKTTEVCIYDVVIPHGGPLGDLAPLGDDGRWIQLWRDWLWATLRAIPKQRTPYNTRASGALVEVEEGDSEFEESKDVSVAWDCLTRDGSAKQASTYYLGAMDVNAERVSFRDRGRYMFLLHFWPFAVHIFVPRIMDAKGKTESDGFVTCIPEVAQLSSFVRRHERALKRRSPDGDRIWAGRPKESIVDLADAAALESERWLQSELSGSVQQDDARATAGFLVVHSCKEGNSVRIRSNRLIAPSRSQVDRSRIIASCWSHLAKHRVLRNVLDDTPWWHGFERTCSNSSSDFTIKDSAFRHDAELLFKHFHPEDRMSDNPTEASKDASPRPLESLVLHIVQNWISGRLDGKYQLKWSEIKGQPQRQREYDEKKSKLATEAFLAARSRPGREFARWFTATLCSVNQRLTEAEFVVVAKALDGCPDQVRSLTLLALSARG